MEWVRDFCLTQIQQFVSYIKAETSTFQRDDDEVRLLLDQHVSWILIPSQLVCSFSLVLGVSRTSNKYQIHSLRFDPSGLGPTDLPHSKQAR